ncbi:surface carbohydrate biosynthesis protein [Oceanobacillus sp. CF4.6]|uniref:surface carbohydrate biosynthesis protein n=1 Tax=Oceanobacillus sp. CF4.6 TaxID=3373080 RepID=UPI003EE76889
MATDKRWLYLPVEVKVRELDAKLLLAYYAVREGYHIVIGEHKMVELASEVYPKGIFFSKGYPHRFRRRIITNAKVNGHMVVELDEEGLILTDKTQYVRERMKADMLDLVTQEYCWGIFQKEAIAEAYPDYNQKCHIVGNPRFDLLKPKFNLLYKEDVERIKSNYGMFILINTRFSEYNFLNGKKTESMVSMYMKKLYDHFLEMTKAASGKFPAINFVIRPHPSENIASYRKAFSFYNNVHVIHEGNIIKWLMAAEVVIHNGCTSSIEAFLLEKPIISYIPITSKVYDMELTNKLGIKATTIEEVNTTLENMLSNPLEKSDYNEQIEQSKKSLSRYYGSSGSNFSYENIMRLLNTISLSPVPRTFSPSVKKFYLKENKSVKHYFSSLSKGEIQDFFRKLDKLEITSNRVVIKNLGKNLFSIQAK